jgi:hypothetical protein
VSWSAKTQPRASPIHTMAIRGHGGNSKKKMSPSTRWSGSQATMSGYKTENSAKKPSANATRR